jgi:hypothetical protein
VATVPRDVWVVPASKAYAPGHQISDTLFNALGLADSSDVTQIIQIGSVVYAVAAGPGTTAPGGWDEITFPVDFPSVF